MLRRPGSGGEGCHRHLSDHMNVRVRIVLSRAYLYGRLSRLYWLTTLTAL